MSFQPGKPAIALNGLSQNFCHPDLRDFLPSYHAFLNSSSEGYEFRLALISLIACSL